MRKLVLVLITTIALSSYFACSKSTPQATMSCTPTPPVQDSAAIVKFAGDTIPLTKDTTGLYFHIIDSGSKFKPLATSQLLVTYVARIIPTNQTFDSAVNSNLGGSVLGQLIAGWQIGLPKIGIGGRIQLFIPSAYAWGCTGDGNIPADAPVFFDIQLLAVN